MSATFIVRGRYAFGLLAAERGVHRLVRISPFDAQHRRQTSFASLDVVPFLEDVSGVVDIDEKDLRIDTYRSSGAGGQHVNKTDSAVRLTHLPTGIVVTCQNQRSQTQNKAKAMQVLGAKLAERQRAEHQATLDQLSGDRTDNAWGNQIRSYVMAPYQLVKDLRTNAETGNVEAVLDGDLDADRGRAAPQGRGAPPALLNGDVGSGRLSAEVSGADPIRRRVEVALGRCELHSDLPRVDCALLLMIKFQNVTKTYKGSTVALQDCSVEIDKGEFVFLVGPSGSGKTTFIRLLLREEMPDSGRIWEAGKEIGHLAKWRIPYLRRNIGCVFQDFRLLPNKTVFENVAFALEVIGRPKHVITTQVPQVLDLVGLAKKRDNLPHELSGGEQQRVAVARAFVNRPLILLADEPTGNLDPKTSLGIMRLLDQINRTGTTVIIATHDAGMVDQMRRRVIELDRGIVVRDQAHGVYDIDSATAAGGAGSPTGTMVDQMPSAMTTEEFPDSFAARP